MLTVPEAAKRAGKDPETIRRWIRSGKLRSTRVGTQHLVDEADLASVAAPNERAPYPRAWRRTLTGEPMPDVVDLVRRSREAH
jgi:excisionase family DNA binding protein